MNFFALKAIPLIIAGSSFCFSTDVFAKEDTQRNIFFTSISSVTWSVNDSFEKALKFNMSGKTNQGEYFGNKNFYFSNKIKEACQPLVNMMLAATLSSPTKPISELKLVLLTSGTSNIEQIVECSLGASNPILHLP